MRHGKEEKRGEENKEAPVSGNIDAVVEIVVAGLEEFGPIFVGSKECAAPDASALGRLDAAFLGPEEP